MIGSRAKWIHTNDTREESEERGCVVAVERGGMPATWSALVLSDQGDLRSPPLDRLTIEPAAGAEERGRGEVALNALAFLSDVLIEHYGPADVGQEPIDRALELLTHHRAVVAELSKTLSELSAATSEVESLNALLETARTELAKIRAERDALLEGKKRKNKKSDKSDEDSAV